MTYIARVVVARPALVEFAAGGSYNLNVAGQSKPTVAEAIASAVERAGVGAGTPRVAELERYVTQANQDNARLGREVDRLGADLAAMTEFRDNEAATVDELRTRVAELEQQLRDARPWIEPASDVTQPGRKCDDCGRTSGDVVNVGLDRWRHAYGNCDTDGAP